MNDAILSKSVNELINLFTVYNKKTAGRDSSPAEAILSCHNDDLIARHENMLSANNVSHRIFA